MPPKKKGKKGKKEEEEEKKVGEDGEEEEKVYEATKEEIEEERMDAAVRLIQGLYRSRKAKRVIRDLVRANYVKEYDKDTGFYVYRNKSTGKVQTKKPRALGDDDLPNPTTHVAPDDYQIRKSSLKQYAFIVHCTKFDSPRIPDLKPLLHKDHEELVTTLTHPYLCRYNAEDCIFCENITKDTFLHNFDTMKRKVQAPDASFFFYFSTHCAYVQRGKHKGSYFMFSDSNYHTLDLLDETGLSIPALVELLKEVPCNDRTLVLDITHEPRPHDTLLRSKYFYPPRSIYRKIAVDSSWVVIGSCKLGTAAVGGSKKEGEDDDEGEESESEKKKKKGGPEVDEEAAQPPKKRGFLPAVFKKKGAVTPEIENGPPGALSSRSLSSHSMSSKTLTRATSSRGGAELAAAATTDPKKEAEIAAQVKKNKEKEAREKRKMKKKASSIQIKKDANGNIVVVNEWEKYKDMRKQAVKNAGTAIYKGGVYAYDKFNEHQAERTRKANLVRSKYEHALHTETNTLFGLAIIRGLGGAAASQNRTRITARQLHASAKEYLNQELSTTYKHYKRTMTPMLAAPKKSSKDRFTLDTKTTVCPIPGVPPRPAHPTAAKIRFTSIVLEWRNPAFSGAAPLRYEVQMRGGAKYNRQWKLVGEWSVITKPEFNTPHLTTGLEVQFRVRAFNYGGWSEFSEVSEFFTPTAATTLTVQETMKSAADLGLRNVIQAMRKYSTNGEAISLGCWAICRFAAENGGFARCSVGKEIVEVCLDAMKTFPLNAGVQAYCCLGLGWACYGHEGAAKYAIKLGAKEAIENAKKNLPMDAGVWGNSSWATSNIMPNSAKDAPAEIHKRLVLDRRLLGIKYMQESHCNQSDRW
mmetsp:Transcript_37602/g.101955  ORF Transcript_37602/g.101955 Transcript_37602/m.101955 type:complete len:863 (-) Transcript_37602:894-3482(-)